MTIEFRNTVVAFALTVLAEIGVAMILGFRKRREIAAVFWVNVFTHPTLMFGIWILGDLRTRPSNALEIIALESIVVLVEWLLLCYALYQRGKMRILVLALTMNCLSCAAGFILPVWAG